MGILRTIFYSVYAFQSSTARAESGWGLGFVCIISLLEMHGKEENLTENHTAPMVSEIHTNHLRKLNFVHEYHF
jgi:hypothetical protein